MKPIFGENGTRIPLVQTDRKVSMPPKAIVLSCSKHILFIFALLFIPFSLLCYALTSPYALIIHNAQFTLWLTNKSVCWCSCYTHDSHIRLCVCIEHHVLFLAWMYWENLPHVSKINYYYCVIAIYADDEDFTHICGEWLLYRVVKFLCISVCVCIWVYTKISWFLICFTSHDSFLQL